MDGNEPKALLADGSATSASSRIVKALSERGALSARQIAAATGLAKSTISTVLAELRKSGLVVEGTLPPGGNGARLGRPASVLTLNPQAGTCVGIMVGLAEIRMIVADVSHAIIHSTTVELGPDFSAERAAEVTCRLIRETYAEHGLPLAGLLGVGVSPSPARSIRSTAPSSAPASCRPGPASTSEPSSGPSCSAPSRSTTKAVAPLSPK